MSVQSANQQEEQFFDYCLTHRNDPQFKLATYYLSQGWSLVQYKSPSSTDIPSAAPDTPVWAIWGPNQDDEKNCVVIYGDPHVVYYHDKTTQDVDFTVASFKLETGDTIISEGAAEDGNLLSRMYIQRTGSTPEAILVWQRGATPNVPKPDANANFTVKRDAGGISVGEEL